MCCCLCFNFSGYSVELCDVIAGSPQTNVDTCINSDGEDCDAFIDDECEYDGNDTGFSSDPGHITDPASCQSHCQIFEVKYLSNAEV